MQHGSKKHYFVPQAPFLICKMKENDIFYIINIWKLNKLLDKTISKSLSTQSIQILEISMPSITFNFPISCMSGWLLKIDQTKSSTQFVKKKIQHAKDKLKKSILFSMAMPHNNL